MTRPGLRWLRNVGPSSPAFWVAGLVALSLMLGGVVWAQQRAHEASAAAGDVTAAKVEASDAPSDDATSASPSPSGRHTAAAKPGGKKQASDKHASQSRKHTEKPRSEKAESLASTVQKAVKKVTAPTPTVVPPATFRLASFNVLGASHTARGGNKPGFAAGSARMRSATGLIGAAGADVVGFQEFEQPQFATFMNLTRGAWQTYPGMSMGRGPVRNSVAWRTDTFTLVDRGTIPVPYFHGQRVPMPWVVLEHRATGHKIAFINIHNPVSNARRGNNERWRDLATSMEVALVRKLKPVAPVVLMGDFNERAEAYCRVTGAGMHAANGGVLGGGCRPPAGAGIDWIFGTPDVGFDGYVRNQSSLVRRTTDHPLVTVTVTLGQ